MKNICKACAMWCPPSGCEWLVPLGTGPSARMDNPALSATIVGHLLSYLFCFASTRAFASVFEFKTSTISK